MEQSQRQKTFFLKLSNLKEIIQNVFSGHSGIKLTISLTEDNQTISNIWRLKSTKNNTWAKEKSQDNLEKKILTKGKYNLSKSVSYNEISDQ